MGYNGFLRCVAALRTSRSISSTSTFFARSNNKSRYTETVREIEDAGGAEMEYVQRIKMMKQRPQDFFDVEEEAVVPRKFGYIRYDSENKKLWDPQNPHPMFAEDNFRGNL